MRALCPSKIYLGISNPKVKEYILKFCHDEGIKLEEGIPKERILHEVYITDEIDTVTMGQCVYVYYQDISYKELMQCTASKFLFFREGVTTYDEVVSSVLYTGSSLNRNRLRSIEMYQVDDDFWYENALYVYNFKKRICIRKRDNQELFISAAQFHYIYFYSVKKARLPSYSMGMKLRRKWGHDILANIRRCEDDNYRNFVSSC